MILSETFLDRFPVWLLCVGTVLLLLAGNELGFRLGTLRRNQTSDNEKAPVNAMMGATLGLLAFLLAFSFGMSSARFDARKQLVLEEASAILRCYQRAGTLSEPHAKESSELLRSYVMERIRLSQLNTLEEMEEAVRRSESVQDALWQQASALTGTEGAILAGFLQSLTELTDLQMKRVRASIWNRVPATVQVTLYGIAFLGLATIGYGAGLGNVRATIPTLVLILAFSAIIVLIVDMERPRQQLFEVTQEPMTDVARRIGAFPGP